MPINSQYIANTEYIANTQPIHNYIMLNAKPISTIIINPMHVQYVCNTYPMHIQYISSANSIQFKTSPILI